MSEQCPAPKMHGTTSVNNKGQIVIPADVRAMIGINPGDQLVVISNGDYGLGLFKADTLQEFLTKAQKIHPEVFQGLDKTKL